MSSEPPFFHRIIPNAWNTHQCNKNKSLTLTLPQNHGGSDDHLPLYHFNATEKEKLDYNPKKIPLNLLPKIVCLTFAALGYQTITSQDQPCILGPAIVIAFVASLSVVLFSNNDTITRSYPRLAAIVELIGYLSFTLSFLVMIRVFFSGNLILWIIIGGLAMGWIMLILLIRLFTWSLSLYWWIN